MVAKLNPPHNVPVLKTYKLLPGCTRGLFSFFSGIPCRKSFQLKCFEGFGGNVWIGAGENALDAIGQGIKAGRRNPKEAPVS